MNDRPPFFVMSYGIPAPFRHLSLFSLLLALLTLGLSPGVVQAQEQEARQITFNEAIRLALEKNIALKQSAYAVEQQSIVVSQRRGAFLPNLSVSSGVNRNFGRVVDPNDFTVSNESVDFLDADIGSTVNVFNGFSDVASLKEAKLQFEASDLNYERSRQTVVFTVMSNFLDLIEQQEQIRIQEENLEAQQQLLLQIEEFVNVGARPISDLYQQQAAAASAELTLLNAQRAYQISEANLIQTLQLDPFALYAFVAPSVEEANITIEEYALPNLLQTAFQNRPDLQAQEFNIRAAQQGIRAARSSYWPSVNFRASYGSEWASSRDGSLFNQFDARRGGGLGFSISVPLFDRFSTRNNTQLAQVQFNNARLELDNIQQNIAVQVRQAYLDYETADKSLDVAQKQVRAAELALEASQERYNVGAATFVELSQSRADYVRAAGDLVRAQYNLVFQEKLIEYYLGVLDPSQPLFE